MSDPGLPGAARATTVAATARTARGWLGTQRVGHLGTGLTRVELLDWPATVGELIAEFHPDIIVAQIGINDTRPMIEGIPSLSDEDKKKIFEDNARAVFNLEL